MRRTAVVSAVLSLVVVAGLTSSPADARVVSRASTSAAASAGSGYTPLASPYRLRANQRIAGRGTLTLPVAAAGVPSSATSVVFNVTPASATQAGYLSVFAAGATRPATGNVNFVPSHPIANLVVSRLSSGGAVSIFNGSPAAVSVYVDVTGYFTPAADGQGAFSAVTPVRAMNSAAGIGVRKGALGPKRQVTLQVTGSGTGVPAGASAVVINLIAAQATRAGLLTAYPYATHPKYGYETVSPPGYATMNYTTGSPVDHLAVVPVSHAGTVTFYNYSPGSVQLYGDVFGYFAAGDPTSANAFGALPPSRPLSTKIAPRATVTVPTLGRGGVPRTGVASVALNLHVADAAGRGYLSVNRDTGTAVTTALSFSRGQTLANLTMAKVNASGRVSIYNGSSSTLAVSADVTGYTLSSATAVPAGSTSRYVRNITGVSGTGSGTDYDTMRSEGQTDCAGGSKLVLLDIGVQSNSVPADEQSSNGVVTTKDDPGVRLSSTSIRLHYDQLVSALEGYLDGFGSCTGTIAVGTNSDGDWTAYPAKDKALDWATKVIEPLQAYAETHQYSAETVVGASDIEANFEATSQQARYWVSYYLQDLQDDGAPVRFVDNGSLDGCPIAYGSAAACSGANPNGPPWTTADYAAITHDLGSAGQISVLPQIYLQQQAVQWANLDARVPGKLDFLGSLTDFANNDEEFTPTEGWAALQHALSTLIPSPSIPQLTDLQPDEVSGDAQPASRSEKTSAYQGG